MKPTTILSFALAIASVVVIGCAGPENATEKSEGGWVGEIRTEGNVTNVVNESDSVRGGGGRHAADEHVYVIDPRRPPGWTGTASGVPSG